MNHSLLSADCGTHLKVVAVALVAAIAFVGIGLKTHLTASSSEGARSQVGYLVVKAGKPVVATRSETSAIR